MTALARLRDAFGMTLCVYGFRTGAAVLLAWPALADLFYLLDERVYGSEVGPAEVPLLLELLTRDGYRYLSWAAGCIAGYALLTPLLSLAWLCALTRRQTVAASLARAFGGYLPALALGAASLFSMLATAAIAVLALSEMVTSVLPASVWAENTQLAVFVSLIAFATLFIGTVHDLARAGLAHGLSPCFALRSALRLTSARTLSLHALAAAAALACVLLAEVFARALPGAPRPVLLLTQQSLVLGAVLLRGVWLALAADRVASIARGR